MVVGFKIRGTSMSIYDAKVGLHPHGAWQRVKQRRYIIHRDTALESLRHYKAFTILNGSRVRHEIICRCIHDSQAGTVHAYPSLETQRVSVIMESYVLKCRIGSGMVGYIIGFSSRVTMLPK